MADETNKVVRRVCVTGGGGYIGSWLIKNLLQKGYTVNATLRDPGDETKSGPLLQLAGAEERLKLFKADLLEEGSFDSAVEACDGVFHVASPMLGSTNNTMEDFVVPAVKGVLNVLQACTRAISVKRVIYTSSIVAAAPRNNKGEFIQSCLDESCWTPLDFMKSQPSVLAMYMVSKTLAEQEAFKYGHDNKLEVVTIGPAVVGGPSFTVDPPFSSTQVILCILKGQGAFCELESMLGSTTLVHIEDVCNAHIFLMEQPNVEGRHICGVDSSSIRHLKDLLSQRYPQFKNSSKVDENDGKGTFVPCSSKKLHDMGFSYKYGLVQILYESTESALKHGILEGLSHPSEVTLT